MQNGLSLISIFTLIGSAGLSWLLVYRLSFYARSSGMLALPGDRQSHTEPTPTGAGLGIVLAFCVGSVLLYLQMELPAGWLVLILPLTLLLSVMGFVDDRQSLPVLMRLFVQLAVSIALIVLLSRTGWSAGVLACAAGVVIVTGTMNAFNFMDGSNGMAGFQVLFCAMVLAVVFALGDHTGLMSLAILLAAVMSGFLPLNFPKARVFMGDAGSIPIAFLLISLISIGILVGALSLLFGVMMLSVFLTDSTLTLMKRVIRREQWYTPHKQHIYQRLIANGISHSRVLLWYQAINAVLVVPALVLVRTYPETAWWTAGVMFLLLITGWYLASLKLEVRK